MAKKNSIEATAPPKSRRRGTERSATRLVLIDTAEQLIIEEGYAAVTTRQLATKAGLKPQLVHYYFRSMDDLFVAVLRRGGDRALEHLTAALESAQPMQAVWNLPDDGRTARLTVEFLALAHRHKAIRKEVKRYAERLRSVQADALARQFGARSGSVGMDPMTAVVTRTAIAHLLFLESNLGITLGHKTTQDYLERQLAPGKTPKPTASIASRRVAAARRRLRP